MARPHFTEKLYSFKIKRAVITEVNEILHSLWSCTCFVQAAFLYKTALLILTLWQLFMCCAMACQGSYIVDVSVIIAHSTTLETEASGRRKTMSRHNSPNGVLARPVSFMSRQKKNHSEGSKAGVLCSTGGYKRD